MSQSLSKLLVHIIVSTKNRYPFLSESIRRELYPYIISVLNACESPVLGIGGTAEHVHILCVLSKNHSIAKIVEEFKKSSSKWIKTKGPEFEKFFWQSGYGVFSVSQSDTEAVMNYIKNQEQHHKAISFQDEYRRFLQKYDIAFDEQYVWE